MKSDTSIILVMLIICFTLFAGILIGKRFNKIDTKSKRNEPLVQIQDVDTNCNLDNKAEKE